jgi:hypothetical protein
MPKRCRFLAPQIRKVFEGTVTISGETSGVSRHAAVEKFMKLFPDNCMILTLTFDRNSCRRQATPMRAFLVVAFKYFVLNFISQIIKGTYFIKKEDRRV